MVKLEKESGEIFAIEKDQTAGYMCHPAPSPTLPQPRASKLKTTRKSPPKFGRADRPAPLARGPGPSAPGGGGETDEEETPAPQATKRKAETKAAVPAKKAKAEGKLLPGKRKAKAAVKEESPAKKAKVEGEQSTLFVGNLTEKVTEEKLRKFFKKKGLEVLDLRYLTKSSGVSLAYVDVPAAEEATALELNGATLAGTELKVEKAKSKKQEPKSPGQNFGNDNDRDARTLFLKNLSYDSTKESVMEVFTDAVDVRIPVFKDSGRPKGIAFVEFESEAKVEEVKSSMDGVEVDGRRVQMDYVGSKAQFTGKSPQGKSPGGGFNAPATPSKTLVVKNLSYNTTSEGLQEAFEGSTGARVIMKPGTDRSRGFGYVDFESEEAAKEAMDNMNQSELDGRTINVEFGMARGSGGGGGGGGFNSPAQVSKTLIVKNLSYDTGEDDLQQAFEGCTSARVITDRESGRSKGFGYIDFDSEDAAQEALKSMDEQEVGGRRIRLDFALPRGEGGGRVRYRSMSGAPGLARHGRVMLGALDLTLAWWAVRCPWPDLEAGPVQQAARCGTWNCAVHPHWYTNSGTPAMEDVARLLWYPALVDLVVEEVAVVAVVSEVAGVVAEGVVAEGADVAVDSGGVVAAEGVEEKREGIKAFEGKKKTFDD
ncbi:hypothetical protein Bbelb_336510 [Branchiostoma belcheri]|nr:hypothetical protein Bbelb_336510 [Branchiostoma belcheri]